MSTVENLNLKDLFNVKEDQESFVINDNMNCNGIHINKKSEPGSSILKTNNDILIDDSLAVLGEPESTITTITFPRKLDFKTALEIDLKNLNYSDIEIEKLISKIECLNDKCDEINYLRFKNFFSLENFKEIVLKINLLSTEILLNLEK